MYVEVSENFVVSLQLNSKKMSPEKEFSENYFSSKSRQTVH